jgi:butyryl-CoA dehydrogenase
MVREFAQHEIAPVAGELDQSCEFPWENVKKMSELGLLGVPWPEEVGGAGMDGIAYMIAIHELAKVDASHAITVSAHTTLGTSPIMTFGTPEQKERFIPHLASGQVLGGFGLTEPGAGSDAGGTQTTAVKADGGWILNGSKIFITHAGVGEVFVATAVTDRERGAKGITSFIVTKPTVDLERRASWGWGTRTSSSSSKGCGRGRRRTRWGGALRTPASWCSRTRSSRTRTCWGARDGLHQLHEDAGCRAASASARFRSASPRARTKRR